MGPTNGFSTGSRENTHRSNVRRRLRSAITEHISRRICMCEQHWNSFRCLSRIYPIKEIAGAVSPCSACNQCPFVKSFFEYGQKTRDPNGSNLKERYATAQSACASHCIPKMSSAVGRVLRIFSTCSFCLCERPLCPDSVEKVGFRDLQNF